MFYYIVIYDLLIGGTTGLSVYRRTHSYFTLMCVCSYIIVL